jgi:hypothetical protein
MMVKIRESWPFAVVLGCVFLCLAACDGDERRPPLHVHVEFGSLADFSQQGVVPAGVYLFDVTDIDEQRRVATAEIELAGAPTTVYNYLTDPVSHIGLRPGVLILRLDSIDLPRPRRFRTLELGTLFALGTSTDKPLTVEFFGNDGKLIGEPYLYATVPNNSAHPEQIDPLRISMPDELGVPVTIRVSTVVETYVPIVFIGLSVP